MDPPKKTHLPPPLPSPHLEYGECLKNHAASIGAHALDGCGEFALSTSSNPSDPSSLTCAACGCHRNFHRRILRQSDDDEDSGDGGDDGGEEEEMAGSHVLLTLKTGDGTQDCDVKRMKTEDGSGMRRRRFRSRFSKEQKEGMMELAEKLGWRLQRRDEGMVEEGCRKVGVERGVFKVWMHNNKQAVFEMKKNSGKAFVDGGEVEGRSGNGVVAAFANGGGLVKDVSGNGVAGASANGPSTSSPPSSSRS